MSKLDRVPTKAGQRSRIGEGFRTHKDGEPFEGGTLPPTGRLSVPIKPGQRSRIAQKVHGGHNIGRDGAPKRTTVAMPHHGMRSRTANGGE
jgi:hypothetical protein